MAVEISQLDPRIQQMIADEVARQRAADARKDAPKELSPQEQVDAAFANVYLAAARERPAPGNNDHVVGAIITYLQAVKDRDDAAAAEANAPKSVGSSSESTSNGVGTSVGSASNISAETSTVTTQPSQAVNTAPAVEAAAPHAGD